MTDFELGFGSIQSITIMVQDRSGGMIPVMKQLGEFNVKMELAPLPSGPITLKRKNPYECPWAAYAAALKSVEKSVPKPVAKPKPTKRGYELFADQERPHAKFKVEGLFGYEKVSYHDIMREVSFRWNMLAPNQREYWKEKARLLKEANAM